MKKTVLTSLMSCFFLVAVHAQFTLQTQSASCFGNCNGTLAVLPNGSYQYLWSNSATTQTISGLCAGVYSVTVFDMSSVALDTITDTITQPTAFSGVHTTSLNPRCFGEITGHATLHLNGATPPYKYLWSNGDTTSTTDNLAAGSYTVTATDAHACTVSAASTVTQPTQLTATLSTTPPSACGVCDGTASVTASGGTPPYAYYWLDDTISATTRTNLCENLYQINVFDANFCGVTKNASLLIWGNLTASISSTVIDCAHPLSTETLNISGGPSGNYQISWADGSGTAFGQNTITHDVDQAGIFRLYVEDLGGCSGFLYDTIINAGLQVDTIQFVHPNFCNAPTGGKIQVLASNGTPPYSFLWSTGSTIDSIEHLRYDSTYSVTVTDNAGCSTHKSYYLQSLAQYYYAWGTQQEPAGCLNNGLGTAAITTFGGTAPYIYQWGTNPPEHTSVLSNVSYGTYHYTVTDQLGCVVSDSTYIAYSSFSYYVYLYPWYYPNCGNPNGIVIADAEGGTPPYSYLWSNNQHSDMATGLNIGTYTITVTDQGGCSTTGSIDLPAGCYNTVNGSVFNDANGNCTFDVGDSPLQYALLIADNGTDAYYGLTDISGNYSIQVRDTGTFTITAMEGYTCGVLTPCGIANQPVTFHNFNQTVYNYNFGLTNVSGFDLALHPGWTSANPGFEKDYWIYYYNQSVQPYSGPATIVFQYDSNLIYQSCDSPSATHDPLAHTLTWNVTGVDDWSYVGLCHFQVPVNIAPAYQLQSDYYILPNSGDCDSSNNYIHYSDLVVGSLDPNEKQVSPAGQVHEEDSVLTYTIHFQNTGTDTTWFVVIKDTLSANLDPTTVRNIASSHTYSEFHISGKGILTWVFKPIFLVDSNTNEPASKGFVSFTVKKKKNLAAGSTISNRASIYFDYNTPILTNTVADTIAAPNYVFNLAAESGIAVTAYPNPFTATTTILVKGLKEKFDFNLIDVTGRTIRTIIAIENSQFELNRETLPAGVYFYKISTGGKKLANGKLVIE